jgi:sterol desaturase/sphingolipid hydroxylase (fatty acid hydroxylase superfamily)
MIFRIVDRDEMSHSQPTRSVGIDPIKTALGVFVVLGVVLTAVAGYAILQSVSGLATMSAELGMTLVFGILLVVTAAAVHRATPAR